MTLLAIALATTFQILPAATVEFRLRTDACFLRERVVLRFGWKATRAWVSAEIDEDEQPPIRILPEQAHAVVAGILRAAEWRDPLPDGVFGRSSVELLVTSDGVKELVAHFDESSARAAIRQLLDIYYPRAGRVRGP